METEVATKAFRRAEITTHVTLTSTGTENGTNLTVGNCAVAPADSDSDDGVNYMTITYILIGIVGVIGNLFVVVVLMSSKALRQKIPNILLIHQSVVDGVTSLFLIITSTNTYDNSGGHTGLMGELYCRIWAMKVSVATFAIFLTEKISRDAFGLTRQTGTQTLWVTWLVFVQWIRHVPSFVFLCQTKRELVSGLHVCLLHMKALHVLWISEIAFFSPTVLWSLCALKDLTCFPGGHAGLI